MSPQKDQDSRKEAHERLHARSYNNLKKAREDAEQKSGYDFSSTRRDIASLFRERFGTAPYEWQLDVTEAILLRLDSVVIAGTGAGKTMPFMMPLLLDKKKKALIISPLKVLQADQAARFQKMQIPTVAVNGDTWTSKLRQELADDEYQGILTSPEMCLLHPEFRKMLTDEKFQENICAVIVDEAHCISQWGGDFRKVYALLEKLRALLPPNIPFLATSATLPPSALREVRSKLAIDAASSFYINLGNDRPNIAMCVQEINGSDDYEALRPLLAHDVTSHEDLEKAIVFTNSVNTTQMTCKKVRQFYPKHLRKYVDYLHSLRTPSAKRRVMRCFRSGKIMILIATEAAGMGADIPDIKKVIQFGVPRSLEVWVQRAGRVGRNPEIEAHAILLVEKSMFVWKKKRRKRKADDADSEDSEDSSSDDGSEDEVGGESEKMEWGKKVDTELRKWITCEECRRDFLDEYFNNPVVRKAPTHLCCDNCSRVRMDSNERPQTPQTPSSHSGSSSEHTTPSKFVNSNGKRRMERLKNGPSTRRGQHLASVRAALERWRFKTKHDRYTLGSVTTEVIMPNPILTTLASNAQIRTVDDMATKISPPWIMARRHGDEILELLKVMDDAAREEHTREKQERAAERKQATAARQAERQRVMEAERESKRQEKAAAKVALAAEQERVRAERAAAKLQKQRDRDATKASKPKRPRKAPLAGSSVFNVDTLLSPSTSPSTQAIVGLTSTPSRNENNQSTLHWARHDSSSQRPFTHVSTLLTPAHSLSYPSQTPSPITPRPRPRPATNSTLVSCTSTPTQTIVPARPRPRPCPQPPINITGTGVLPSPSSADQQSLEN